VNLPGVLRLIICQPESPIIGDAHAELQTAGRPLAVLHLGYLQTLPLEGERSRPLGIAGTSIARHRRSSGTFQCAAGLPLGVTAHG